MSGEVRNCGEARAESCRVMQHSTKVWGRVSRAVMVLAVVAGAHGIGACAERAQHGVAVTAEARAVEMPPPAAETEQCGGAPSVSGVARQRIDLRVLVLSGGEPGTEMLKEMLRTAGVPFTEVKLSASDRPVLSEAYLSDTGQAGVRRAKFQAVVAPDAELAALDDAEREALVQFQREFGVRRVDAYVYPSATVHLAAPAYSGVLDGSVATFGAGALQGSFDYLAGEIAFDDVDPAVAESYGYLAQPLAADPERDRWFEAWLEVQVGDARGALMGVFHDAGREELVIACALNQFQLHQRALAIGILDWLTRGVYLGQQRNYLTLHVDDIFLADARWIPEHDCTRGNDCPAGVTAPDIAMNAQDAAFMSEWQTGSEFALSMVYNGGAYDAAVEDGAPLLAAEALFGVRGLEWINHTYTHEYLGCTRDHSRPGFPCQLGADGVSWVALPVVQFEISRNLEFARAHGLPVDASQLVTGEHSGLRRAPDEPSDNPYLVDALREFGVGWIAADASREPEQRAVGGALTVPRYPMNLFFNTGTRAELVDEFNFLHGSDGAGACGGDGQPLCVTALDPETGFDTEIVPREARALLLHALSNDPRPHFAHQSNVAEERLLYPVLDRAIATYRGLFAASAPIVQLTLAEAGAELRDRAAWSNDAARVDAFVENGRVQLNVSDGAPVRVPLTLRVGGDEVLRAYAGVHGGWVEVRPGESIAFELAAEAL